MKKILALLTAFTAIAISLCACSSSENNASSVLNSEEAIDTTVSTEANEEVTTVNALAGEVTGTEAESFQLPDDCLHLDTDTDDLNSSEVTFVYDAKDRISSCTYYSGGYENYITYTYYDNNTVEVMAFVNGVVAVDDIIPFNTYDANAGFTVYNGYYFKSIIF